MARPAEGSGPEPPMWLMQPEGGAKALEDECVAHFPRPAQDRSETTCPHSWVNVTRRDT